MSENEHEESGAVQPNVEGPGTAGAGGQQSGSTVGGSTDHEQFGKQVAAACYSVVGMLGGLGGVSAFVGPFAKGGLWLITLTILVVGIGVLLWMGAKWAAERVGKKIPASAVAVTGVAAFALVLGAGVGYAIGHKPSSNQGGGGSIGGVINTPSSTPVNTPISSVSASPSGSASTAACAKPLTITSPANDTKIVGHVGVRVGITACGLAPGETGWLFDYDESSATYGLDGDGGPILTGDQVFTFADQPVGQAGDQNEYVELTLVLANNACNTALNKIDWNNDQPTSLPANCQIESQVEIIETY